jgi:hypothetical protein
MCLLGRVLDPGEEFDLELGEGSKALTKNARDEEVMIVMCHVPKYKRNAWYTVDRIQCSGEILQLWTISRIAFLPFWMLAMVFELHATFPLVVDLARYT